MTTSTLFGQANPGSVTSGAGNAGTNGLHFTVSASCQLDGIWHYSPSPSTQLPTSIGLYTTQASPATGTLVTSQAASWSGAAGSGWVFAAFTSPPSLTSGVNYMAAKFRNDATNEWVAPSRGYVSRATPINPWPAIAFAEALVITFRFSATSWPSYTPPSSIARLAALASVMPRPLVCTTRPPAK